MSDWKEYELGEVLDIVIDNRGRNPSSYKESGIPVIDNFMIQNQRSINLSKSKRFIDDETFDNFIRKYIQSKDVLITLVGNGFGNISQAPKEKSVIIQNTVGLRGNNKIDNEFLFYNLKFNNEEILNFDRGAVQPSIKVGDLKLLNISIPKIEKQKAIVKVLSSLDDKIDLLQRQNKTLEELAEIFFRQWFIEEAKDEWEVKKLNDFISVKHGYAFKGKFITTEKNRQILVTPGNFKIGGGFKTGKMKYYSELDYPKEYIFLPNDLTVIMTDLSKEGDTLGYPALIPEHKQEKVRYLHNQRVGKIIFKKTISKYFIYFLMKTDVYQWYILGGASGTSVSHTSPTSICNFSFQMPPIEKMQEFDNKAKELITKVHKNTTQIKTLENMRDTLLPKLMSGEARVTNG